MEWPKELVELFDDPLLEGVHPKAVPVTPDDRRVKSLMEIANWVDAHEGNLPQNNGDLKEKMLARSLKALRRDAHDGLRAYDRLNLLEEEQI